MSVIQIPTTWGPVEVELLEGKVGGCSLPFLSDQPRRSFAILKREYDPVSAFVDAVFSGRDALPPALADLAGTDFQRQVWRAIADIPFGRTKTYGELAKAMGRPGAARAVGSACGRNPAPLFIPCHRVLGADSRIGGFSAGLPWKILLLGVERKTRPMPVRRLASELPLG